MTLRGRTIRLDVDGLIIENLSARFKVSKSDQPEPNKAEIVVRNLSESSRQRLEEKKRVPVTLAVGYAEADISSIIFKGEVREVFSEHLSPVWNTTLRTGDGDTAVKKTRVNKSYAPGTSFETAWSDTMNALKDAGLGIGNAIDKFREAATFKDGVKEFLHGGNLQGHAFKEAKSLAKSFGLDLHINDTTLVVTKVGESLDTTKVVLSPSSGLISSPKRGAEGELKLRALLIPDLQPKKRIEVRSRLVKGDFIIRKTVYTGDTSGNDWYADLECVEV